MEPQGLALIKTTGRGHGHQILRAGNGYGYDQADRHLSTLVAGVRQVTLVRDVLDRVVAYSDTDLTTNTTSTVRYGFAGAGDAASAVYDTANNLVETTISLPAGVVYTKRAGGTDVWSYPNTHGDVAATRVNGTVTVFNWDPYGNPINNIPDNSAGTADWGWLGQHQRTLHHPGGLNPVIEMGARVYQPDTGRFQQTDPIEDGTTTNPYSYVPDPVNQYDLNGQCNEATVACIIGILRGTEELPYGFAKWVLRRSGGFVYYVDSRRGTRAVLSSGACSVPGIGNHPSRFRDACKTHDLGYDLLRFLGSTGSRGSTRKAVDDNFLGDMRGVCGAATWWKKPGCLLVAGSYFFGVVANSLLQRYGVP